MNQITIDEIRSNPDIAIDELFESGAFVIPQLIHTETASALKDRCLRVEDSYIQKGGKTDINGSVISHPFLYDSEFYKYVEIPEICDLIERCIGDSIILVNANINNRQISKGLSGNTAPGVGWHTDSRYVQKGQRRLPHGFGYILCICLDNFSEKNGATKIIKGSHLFDEKPTREIDSDKYKIETITLKQGDAFLFDCGIWHTAGTPNEETRWSIFNFYAPWYIKPYYDYPNMFTSKQKLDFSDRLMKLLHFNSQPPVLQTHRVNTVIDIDEFKRQLGKS